MGGVNVDQLKNFGKEESKQYIVFQFITLEYLSDILLEDVYVRNDSISS